ncbi:MAG: hypothetical protein AAF748_07055 [Pseudomonadota bacterium]
MVRTGLAVAVLALSACAPPIPDSNPQPRGVGFGDYTGYQRYTAPLPDRRTTVTPPPVVANAAPPPVAGPPPATTPPPPNAGPLVGPGTLAAGNGVDTSGISDEQNFDAVSNRQTIESDAERLRTQRETFVEVSPEPVPTRSGDTANVVAYALSTTHTVGTKVHRRGGLLSENRYRLNCAGYSTPDLAQEAFLKAGGPSRDRLRLDPDGDGFACAWDPAAYRRLAGR